MFMLRYIQCKYQNKKNNPASRLCSVVLLAFSTASSCYSSGRCVFHQVVVFSTRSSRSLPRRHALHPFIISTPSPGCSPLGSTVRRWAMPSAVGFHPSSLLGYALRRLWVLPSIVGLCLPPLGSTLRCRWVLPSVIGLCPSSLGSPLRRHWAMPFAVGFCPPSWPSCIPPSLLSCRLLLLVVVSSPPPHCHVVSSFSSSCRLLLFLFLLLFLLLLLLLLHLVSSLCHVVHCPRHAPYGRCALPSSCRCTSCRSSSVSVVAPPITPSSTNEQAAHIWKGRGGCGCFEWARSVSDWAHIPQERGGAPCGVNVRRWAGVEEIGSMWWW